MKRASGESGKMFAANHGLEDIDALATFPDVVVPEHRGQRRIVDLLDVVERQTDELGRIRPDT